MKGGSCIRAWPHNAHAADEPVCCCCYCCCCCCGCGCGCGCGRWRRPADGKWCCAVLGLIGTRTTVQQTACWLAGWLAGLGGGAEPRAQRQRRDGRHLSSLLIHRIGRWQKPPRHVSARHVMSADRRVQGWLSVVDRNWKVRQAHLSAAQRPISDGNGSRPQKTSRRVKTGDAAA